MLAVKGFYNGHTFVPLEEIKAKQNQIVIITILDEYIDEKKNKNMPLKEFFGIFDEKDYLEFNEALAECEKVDADGW